MNKLIGWTLVLAMGGASGCASLQSVSVTNIPMERGRPVKATANNVAFLGLHFSNGFADGLQDDLRRQCPNGKVTGLYSKYESKWYVLVQNRSVTASGYCVPGQASPPAPVTTPPAAAAPPPVVSPTAVPPAAVEQLPVTSPAEHQP
jgi:hypothetical protein